VGFSNQLLAIRGEQQQEKNQNTKKTQTNPSHTKNLPLASWIRDWFQ